MRGRVGGNDVGGESLIKVRGPGILNHSGGQENGLLGTPLGGKRLEHQKNKKVGQMGEDQNRKEGKDLLGWYLTRLSHWGLRHSTFFFQTVEPLKKKEAPPFSPLTPLGKPKALKSQTNVRPGKKPENGPRSNKAVGAFEGQKG